MSVSSTSSSDRSIWEWSKSLSREEAAGGYIEVSREEYEAHFHSHLVENERRRLRETHAVDIWMKEHGQNLVYYAMDLMVRPGSNPRDRRFVLVASKKPDGVRETSFVRHMDLRQGSRILFRWDYRGDAGFLIFNVDRR